MSCPQLSRVASREPFPRHNRCQKVTVVCLAAREGPRTAIFLRLCVWLRPRLSRARLTGRGVPSRASVYLRFCHPLALGTPAGVALATAHATQPSYPTRGRPFSRTQTHSRLFLPTRVPRGPPGSLVTVGRMKKTIPLSYQQLSEGAQRCVKENRPHDKLG